MGKTCFRIKYRFIWFLDKKLTNIRISHSKSSYSSCLGPTAVDTFITFSGSQSKVETRSRLDKRNSPHDQELGKHKLKLIESNLKYKQIQCNLKLNTKLTFVSGLSPVAVKRYCQSGRPRCTIIILKYSVKQEARYHHSSERSRNQISGWLVVTPKQ